MFSMALPVTRRALVRAARTTIAVPCWSSWKTGMSRASRSRASISKQRGGGDVLEVDAGEAGGDGLDDLDDRVGVLGVQAQRPGVDAGEPLEQGRLALHDRQRGLRADVAQAQHRGAVRHDRNGVALDGQAAGVLGVLRDRHAHPGHPGRVDHGQVVTVADGVLRRHLDLAAEVHQERTVGDLAQGDALDAPQLLDDLVGVRGGGGRDGDVDAQAVGVGVDHVEGGHRAAQRLHGGCQL
ncbi:hypothetical protein RKD28_001289 [Streptomyces sp. SAI-229]